MIKILSKSKYETMQGDLERLGELNKQLKKDIADLKEQLSTDCVVGNHCIACKHSIQGFVNTYDRNPDYRVIVAHIACAKTVKCKEFERTKQS